MRVLCLGDIVGKPGRQAVCELLPPLIREQQIDLVIANGENIAGGSGITANLFRKLRSYGVDGVTLGDHFHRKHDIFDLLDSSDRIVRPANLSQQAPGKGSVHFPAASSDPDVGEVSVGLFCVLGRLFMPSLPADSPFAAADRVLASLPTTCKIRICDVHAEATSEKVAMGWHLDGRASIVFGTHTHVPTADCRILPGGTAYVTDLGMCGPYDGVLGRSREAVLSWMTDNRPRPFDVATGDVRLSGVQVEVDGSTGRATAIERVEVGGLSVEAAYDAEDSASYVPDEEGPRGGPGRT